MTLPQTEMARIASRAALQALPWLREDVEQECRLRLWLYKPNNRVWAWKIANGAKADLCAAEGKQQEIMRALAQGLPEAPSSYDLKRAKRRRYLESHREQIPVAQRASYNRDVEHSRMLTRERVRRHRQRIRAASAP